MRFGSVHKICSYLLVGAAFLALALSGELSPVLVALSGALAVLSFPFEATRYPVLSSRAWIIGWNVATLAVFGYSALAAFQGYPLPLAGARLLCFLAVNKLWNRRASRDYLQAYVVSFLMLVDGTVLNSELVYAACFVAYVVCATWALTLLHLRREMEENFLIKHNDGLTSERVAVERILNSRRVVGGSFLAGTSLVSLTVFLGATAFFFLFPRVGFNLFASHQRRGLSVGFSDRGVELGQNGLIKDNDQVVMRVEFPPSTGADPAHALGGKPRSPLYFRGIAFDHYEAGRWSSPSGPEHRRMRRWGALSLVGADMRTPIATGTVRARLDESLRQDIYLEPMDATVLFAAATPFAVELPAASLTGAPVMTAEGGWLPDASRVSTGDVFVGGRSGGMRYTAWSLVAPPSPRALSATPALTDEETARLALYLDTANIPPRILELGKRITANAATPHAKTMAVLAYLANGYRYTLDLVHDDKKEPVEEFLFERKAGHCEYFASAMALLLRAAGVPTRHIAGFYGGEWNELGRYMQVRQRDAHAWVEVYLGETGWVTFDPTPATDDLGQSGFADRLRQLIDVVQLTWFKYVIEYDLSTQLDIATRVRRWLSGGGGSLDRLGASGDRLARRLARPVAAAIALLVLVGGVLVARRRRGGSRARLAAATRSLERALRALARRGFKRGTGETPGELARRLTERGEAAAAPFQRLVERYYAARFGDHAVDENHLEQLADEVAAARSSSRRSSTEDASAARAVPDDRDGSKRDGGFDRLDGGS